MGVISKLIDGAVEVSTGSAELVAAKWTALVGGGVALIVLLALILLLVFAPTAGLALAAVLVAVLYILSQGDNDLV